MEFNRRQRRGKTPGFYAALGLCLAAVCLVAVSSAINRRALKKPDASDIVTNRNVNADTAADTAGDIFDVYEQPYDEAETPEDISDEAPTEEAETTPYRELPEESTEPEKLSVEEETEPVDAEEEPAVEADAPLSAPTKLTSPVSGDHIRDYSGAELVYCATFGDWRVHNGLDIAADAGSEVHCAAGGKVLDFVEDPLYGYSVIVDQDDDALMYYCGLSSTCMAPAGTRVSAGDVIGYVGEVPCELSDGGHIHLALMKDGEFVDPAKYIAK